MKELRKTQNVKPVSITVFIATVILQRPLHRLIQQCMSAALQDRVCCVIKSSNAMIFCFCLTLHWLVLVQETGTVNPYYSTYLLFCWCMKMPRACRVIFAILFMHWNICPFSYLENNDHWWRWWKLAGKKINDGTLILSMFCDCICLFVAFCCCLSNWMGPYRKLMPVYRMIGKSYSDE